jgi:glycosyltransferase involved in cell wall biosynthesis
MMEGTTRVLGSSRAHPDGPDSARDAAHNPDRRLNVIHFHSSPGIFGAEHWTHLVLKYSDPARTAVRVLTVGAKPGSDDFARFLHSEGWPATHLADSQRFSRTAIAYLRRAVAEEPVDIVHTHGFKTDVLAYLALRHSRVRLVTTTHGWCDNEGGIVRVYENLGRQFLRGFDRILTLTEDQRSVLLRMRIPAERVRIVRNAVDVPLFDPVYAARAGSRPEPFTVLFVGRVAREKGVLDVVRAIARAGDEARGVVVGTGPGAAELSACVAGLGLRSRVELVGFRDDVRPYFQQATMLALPSYSEGTPRVVMEAFAAGVPVVGSDIPGVRALVRDGVTGLLVPAGDIERLASALRRLHEDAALAASLVANARAFIEERHSPQRLVDDLQREYGELA